MKQLALFLGLVNLMWGEHVVIHMDLNRTIIATDIRQDQGADQVINLSLAKKYRKDWGGGREMNYYDYIYDVVYPGERRDHALRKVRRDAINSFLQWLKQKEDPLYAVCMEERNRAIGALGDQLIFPAFHQLMESLEKSGISYTLVFRTFGHDFDRVEKDLQWQVPRAKFIDGQLVSEEGEYTTPGEIYAYIKKHKHLAIQDDYPYWNRNNERFEFGKQFPLSLNDDVFSIFFDDNIEPYQEVNIVAPIEVESGKYLNINELVQAGHIVPVLTVDAMTDEKFFSKCIPGLPEYREAQKGLLVEAAP